MEFNYRPLSFTCSCGTEGNYFTQIAITHEYNLMVQWLCPNCRKGVTALLPMEDMAQHAPPAPDVKLSLSLFDAQFCRDAKITLEDKNVH